MAEPAAERIKPILDDQEAGVFIRLQSSEQKKGAILTKTNIQAAATIPPPPHYAVFLPESATAQAGQIFDCYIFSI